LTIGSKIAVKVPGSVIEYANDHPTVVTFATFALCTVALALFITATELDIRAGHWRASRLADMQLAASEALGG
jgi:hypothetical protein